MITEQDFVDIEFTDEEMRYIHYLAALRTAGRTNLRDGTKALKFSKLSEKEIDLSGVMGEAAYCVFMGHPLATIKPYQRGGDGGFDFVEAGKTVDVKGVLLRGRDLLHSQIHSSIIADFYVLTWPVGINNMTLIGTMSHAEFLRRMVICPKIARNSKKSRVVRWPNLHSMRDFKPELERME